MGETEAVPIPERSKASGAGGEIQIVEFLMGEEKYAIDLFDVREIVEYTKITPVPGRDRYVRGIIDLRGEITTILDLKEKMGITSAAVNPEQSRIIVIDSSVTKSKTGILVDDVTSVLSVNLAEVDNKTCTMNGTSYIRGIIRQKLEDRESGKTYLVIWLDVPRILTEMGL